MAMATPSWQDRHDTIREALQARSVRAALRDFQISCSTARTLGAASSNAPNTSSTSNGTEHSPLKLGRLLDISLVIAWSADGIPPTRDPNPFRAAANPALVDLRQASLQVQDFKSVKVLQKSAGSLVEVVKSRLDGRVYVLKSLVKRFARRNAAIQTPINETKLLQRQQDGSDSTEQGPSLQLLTPQLLAAFQTQNSVHVLMEYVPSGDFSELLMAASNCGADYPGRASTGLLTEDWILRYSVDMVQAIAWVHDQGFAHRDIKPGNFLLDRSGHLKLCDFSSAAPFSKFSTADSFSASRRAARSSPKIERKVWAFYCSLPTGTCDYLSPEVLEAEEKRILERQQQSDTSSLDDILGLKRHNIMSSSGRPGDTPEEVPGTYGPEIDWWSFGVMLYEMRYGVLPFFASRMEETYEKIKDHRSSLKLDSSVECSTQLKSLIRCFLTDAENRLGHASSDDIHDHGFYRAHNIDWSKQWPMQAPFTPKAPFTPNANLSHPQSPHASSGTDGYQQQGGPADAIAARLHEHSLSVVSSLPSFSDLYNGNPDDFPAFADSRELEADSFRQQQNWWEGERSAGQVDLDHNADNQEFTAAPAANAMSSSPDATLPGMTRSSSSPAVVLGSSSQSTKLHDTSVSIAQVHSPSMVRPAPRWSDCDTTFVGFSYLPHRDAFAQHAELQDKLSTGEMSTVASMDSLANGSAGSPNAWPAGTPVTSTPWHRSGGQSSQSLTMLPTPPSFAPSPIVPIAAANSYNQAAAGATRPSAISFAQQQSFVTPARKPSYMAMHERFRQMQGQEAPIPEDGLANFTPAVPASPYPFPMASVARTSKFTGGKKSVLMRRDLDRARPATPGGGSVGSDSRQSGGSNAVREMSEREAWDEMMAAVQKSVRKKQPPAAIPATPLQSSAARPTGLPRSSTDPQLSASKLISTQPAQQAQLQGPSAGQASRRASTRRALQSVQAPPQVTDRAEPTTKDQQAKATTTAQPSGTLRHRSSRATLIAPRATFKVIPPDSPHDSSPGRPIEDPYRYGAFPSGQLALDIDMYNSDCSDDSMTGRPHLKHKKSARQLLIRAQERGTPTKPKRAQSPPLTDAFTSAPSVAAVLEAAGARSSPPLFLSDQSVRSCASSRDVSYEHGVDFASAPARVRAMSIQRTDKASPDVSNEALSSSLGKTSVTFAPMAYVPVLGAIPPHRDARDGPGSSDGHGDPIGSLREHGRSGKTLRRKDSGEMLSQYRKAKGMGRATSMLSLSERAKADAEALPSRPGTATAAAGAVRLSSSPVNGDGEDDFILGHVESRIRSMAPGGSLPGRTIRRFSSVLSLKEREKVTIERPASQDGTAKTSRGFGRFRSRIASSTLCEEPAEELVGEEVKGRSDRRTIMGVRKSSNPIAEDPQSKLASAKPGRKMGETLPRSFAIRSSSTLLASSGVAKKTGLHPSLDAAARDTDSPGKADLSLMTGLNQRHTALQGSLMGLEQRLARLKARLED